MSTIKIKSFYFSESRNFLVFVENIRENWVYYRLVNILDYGTQHITIEEFAENYKRVGWVETEDEEAEEFFLSELNKEIDPELINYNLILSPKDV